MKLEVGKTYKINHSRRGEFYGKCLEFDDEWGRFKITSGVARFISRDDKTEGAEITTRLSFCRFDPITIPDVHGGK